MQSLRLLAVVAAIAALVAVSGGPAAAIGTDGVELVPLLPRGADGRYELRLGGEPAEVTLIVRNLTDQRRAVRVFAAPATLAAEGPQLAGTGSVEWTGLVPTDVELAGGVERRLQLVVDPEAAPAGDAAVAFVLESRPGETLVTQAASVVRVVPAAPAPPRWPLILVAAALLAVVGGSLARRVATGGLVASPA